MTTVSSSYRRGQVVERTPRWKPYSTGRVLAVDGDKILVDEVRDLGHWPCWWLADGWQRLKPLGDFYLGAKYER